MGSIHGQCSNCNEHTEVEEFEDGPLCRFCYEQVYKEDNTSPPSSKKEAIDILKCLLLDPEGKVSIQCSTEDAELLKKAIDELASSTEERKDVWVAWTNSNLTDGYGERIPLAVCENKFTAKRLGAGKYVQGTDCPVEKVVAVRVESGYCKNLWLSVVKIVPATEDDIKSQQKEDAQIQAEAKALDLGLSPEEIMAIKG